MIDQIIILRGIPGSGKTVSARGYAADGARVVSADDFFTGPDGVYRFDPARLGEAHGACVAAAINALAGDPGGPRALVVDNTNTTAVEVAPYVLLAQAHGIPHRIETLVCDPARAASRNVHVVPAERVAAMAAALDAEVLPPWWNHVDVVAYQGPTPEALFPGAY